MCWPKRFVPVFWGFWGLLIYGGFEVIVSTVMVHVIKSDHFAEAGDTKFLGFYCSVNASLEVSDDWTISSSQYLHSAYYAGVFSTQLLGGYMASRFSPKKVSGISILISSILLLVIPTAINVHYVLVFAIRIVQGLFEGCIIPALTGVISAWTLKSEKSRMLTLFYSGGYLSPAIAFAVSGLTTCLVSWNASLYIYGGLGILWSSIWLSMICDTPLHHTGLSLFETLLFEREGPRVQPGSDKIAEKIPWRNIFLSLPIWAMVVGSFCRNWMYSCLTMGIPQYFKVAFTTNIAEIGLEAALPPVFVTIMTIIGGILIDKLIKSHLVSTTVGRKIALCVGFGGEACCLLGLRFIDKQEIALIVLCVGVAFSGMSPSGYLVNPLDLAPQYAGALTGILRLGMFGSVVNTAVSGKLNPENIRVWQTIFTISGSILIAGSLFYGIFASGERQNWIEDPENDLLIQSVAQDKEDDKLLTKAE